MVKYVKRIFLILTILVAAACSEAESGESSTEAFALPAGTETYDYEAVPGLTKATTWDGEKILAEGDLLNGVRHGSWATYDVNETLKSLETYFKGKKQGVSLVFDRQGYLETKAFYHNDQLNGEYIKYKRNKVIEKRPYQNGQLQGTVRKFYNNGKLMEEAPYINGKLDGLAKWYDQEGNLSIAYRYEKGELVDKDPELD